MLSSAAVWSQALRRLSVQQGHQQQHVRGTTAPHAGLLCNLCVCVFSPHGSSRSPRHGRRSVMWGSTLTTETCSTPSSKRLPCLASLTIFSASLPQRSLPRPSSLSSLRIACACLTRSAFQHLHVSSAFPSSPASPPAGAFPHNPDSPSLCNIVPSNAHCLPIPLLIFPCLLCLLLQPSTLPLCYLRSMPSHPPSALVVPPSGVMPGPRVPPQPAPCRREGK